MTCFKAYRNLALFAGYVLFGSVNVSAQSPAVLNTISPYSHYGIGDLQNNGSVLNSGMGGGGIGYRNDSLIPQYINFQNPASFSSHSFVAYEVALNSNTVMLQSSTAKGSFNQTRLGGIAIAFPVTKWWGAGLGLVPYSEVGYNVVSSDSLTGIGPVTYRYEGNGGVSKVFMANSFRPFAGVPRHFLLSDDYHQLRLANDTTAIKKKIKCRNALSNISIGINTAYMFGTLYNIRRDEFPDSTNTFNTKISKRTVFKDFYNTYGIQYSFRSPWSHNPFYEALADSNIVKKKFFKNEVWYKNKLNVDTTQLFIRQPGVRISFGAVFAPTTPINVSYDLLAQTYKLVSTYESVRDTIIFNNSIPSRIDMPLMGGFGFSLKKDFKWAFQADYMIQMWSDAMILGVDPGLKNSQRITAGFQFQPKANGRGNYLSAIQYRLGARYYKTNLEIHSVQLTETAVNFSMSMPAPYRTRVGEPVARATVSFEYGMRGTTDNNLIREDFFRVTIGLSINDRWFNRYKYD